MSGFRKITKKAESDLNSTETSKVYGLKPWINGGSLASCGNKELDELLGGGRSLGTILSYDSDTYTDYAETFLRYEISEAISMQHSTLLITDSQETTVKLISSLPYNMNQGGSDTSSEAISATETKTEELKIAWQYEKYIKKGNLLNLNRIFFESFISCSFNIDQ